MPIETILMALAEAATPDLIKLGHALFDLIEKRAQGNTIAAASLEAAEFGADVLEQAKFPRGAE